MNKIKSPPPIHAASTTSDIPSLTAACPGTKYQGMNYRIAGIHADSRAIGPGFIFAALQGLQNDGRRFIPQALSAGAVAILYDGQPLPETIAKSIPAHITHLHHADPRLALAHLAAAFYGHPGRQIKTIAITGTNGKTTVAAMIESILNAHGQRVGVVGTTGIRHPGVLKPNPLTTPDPVAFQSCLREMSDNRCDAVVVEVSSHALDQQRTSGTPWQVALFTNLSRDHLDYHTTENTYFEAKARLFLEQKPKIAVINGADPWGQKLANLCQNQHPGWHQPPVTRFGEGTNQAKMDFSAQGIALSWQQTRFDLNTPGETIPIALPAAGRFNVENALAAAAVCWQLGMREGEIVQGLDRFQPPPGRMETIHAGQPFAVVIDFAHTPDALERLLTSARELTPDGRIITVFGCGGNRDPGKRQPMGQIASRLGDLAIITDDNPRQEEPTQIRHTILRGCLESGGRCLEIPNRKTAITHALDAAYPGDAVLITGKGHEHQQITASGRFPFDDAQIARTYLER